MDPPAPPVPVQELLSAAVAATRISFDECLADAPHLHLKRLHALHKAVVGAKVRFTGVLAALRWQRELSGLYQEALSARDHVASTASILKDISQRFEDGQRAIVAGRHGHTICVYAARCFNERQNVGHGVNFGTRQIENVRGKPSLC